jgi:DNA segregation ATPase FtsK/SpoIIIE, S-DNA-T family
MVAGTGTTTGFVVRVVSGRSTGAALLVDGPVVIGRDGDLVVDDPTVSRRHVRLEPAEDRLRVVDLDSAAGLFVMGTRRRDAVIGAGDRFRIGATEVALLRLHRFADAAGCPSLIVDDRGKRRAVEVRDGLTLGRDEDCDICVNDGTVSRRHALIRVSRGEMHVVDLQSANGTTVNGRRVRSATPIVDGDTIQLGRATAHIEFSQGPSPAPVAVTLSVEGRAEQRTWLVDAGPDATVAEVTNEIAQCVDGRDRGLLLLYRADDGALLHPDDRWASVGVLPGDHLVLGAGDASTFPAAPGRHWPHRRAGGLNQLPRTVWLEPVFAVPRIDPPESTSFRGRGIAWQIAGGLGAVLVGVVLVVVNPDYALFGMITGAVGITSITASVMGDQSRRRHRAADYRRRITDLDTELAGARRRQADALNALSPSVAEMQRWVATSSPRLWERRPGDPDVLCPTIGTGARASRIEIERHRSNDTGATDEQAAVVARHTRLERVPVVGPGPAAGSFGITGPSDRIRALLARVIVEAAVLHAPHQLRIWIAAGDDSWEWTRWLPHIAGGGPSHDAAGAAALLAVAARQSLDDRSAGGHDRLDLVVVPAVSRRFEIDVPRPPSGRFLWVVGADDQRDLPSGLAAVMAISSDGTGSVVGSYTDAPLGDLDVDGVDDATAARLAISLARLGGRSEHLAPTGLVQLLGLGAAATVDVAAAWAATEVDRLTVTIGSDDAGAPVTIGFRRDGPHGMIAGTTGSGKSELLQTILTALALRHPPENLTMFLVDFKGGSTFAPLAKLPHVVGVVTDLEQDEALAMRAMTSLDAEIDRRKRLLEAARVPDVIAYARAPGAPPLPDLLVVIDEFALLVERQPEVRSRLDTIATQGRSLGVHLLLATQSPAGVITHQIRTNTNLWICLRVVTEAESLEIIGARDAARITDSSPGRAIVRLGASPDLHTFQAARVARPLPDREAAVHITPIGHQAVLAPRTAGAATTELDVLVERIGAAARDLGVAPSMPLWMPPLAECLPAAALLLDGRPDDRLVVLVGLEDRPRDHAQTPHTIDLTASGHALVVGQLGSGATTTLHQIASDLAGHYSPADVHVYAIDGGAGSLAALTTFPHVGDVVGASDVERFTRLVDRLTRTIDARREHLANASTDFARWRAAAPVAAPWIVLLVDDFASVRESAEQIDLGRLLERFTALLQNGPAVGVHVVIATTQAADLRSRLINLMPARLVLRCADSADYALADVRLGPTAARRVVPGRAVAAGGIDVQVCLPDPGAAGAAVARWQHVDRARGPRTVPRLPSSVDRHALDGHTEGLVIGVGGPEIEPVTLSPEGAPVLLVAGPRQSGRSTALGGLVESMRRPPDHVVVIAPRPSPLRELAERRAFRLVRGADDAAGALEDFVGPAAAGRLLVIDDAEALGSLNGIGDRLERIVRESSEHGVTVLVGARVNDLPGWFEPWARYVISLRRVVLLQPTVDDAMIFGVRLPAVPAPSLPGRGVLIDGQRTVVVQVAR